MKKALRPNKDHRILLAKMLKGAVGKTLSRISHEQHLINDEPEKEDMGDLELHLDDGSFLTFFIFHDGESVGVEQKPLSLGSSFELDKEWKFSLNKAELLNIEGWKNLSSLKIIGFHFLVESFPNI